MSGHSTFNLWLICTKLHYIIVMHKHQKSSEFISKYNICHKDFQNNFSYGHDIKNPNLIKAITWIRIHNGGT